MPFFYYYYGKYSNFYSILCKEVTSFAHACATWLGHSSNQTTKFSTFSACWASKWVGTFPYLLVCKKSNVLKLWTFRRTPWMIFWTDDAASPTPWTALMISSESPSNTPFLSPTSSANWTLVYRAFASTSKAPKGKSSFLLKVAITLPSPSRTITPIPDCFEF